MASGVTVNPQCVSNYQDLKIKKTSRFITFKLSDDMKEIVVDKVSADENYDAFLQALPEVEPRWAVYDVAFEKDGGKRNKLTFFSWSPDDAKIKAKMVYASSRDALRKSLDGIACEIQATDPSEVAWESVLDKMPQFMTSEYFYQSHCIDAGTQAENASCDNSSYRSKSTKTYHNWRRAQKEKTHMHKAQVAN